MRLFDVCQQCYEELGSPNRLTITRKIYFNEVTGGYMCEACGRIDVEQVYVLEVDIDSWRNFRTIHAQIERVMRHARDITHASKVLQDDPARLGRWFFKMESSDMNSVGMTIAYIVDTEKYYRARTF